MHRDNLLRDGPYDHHYYLQSLLGIHYAEHPAASIQMCPRQNGFQRNVPDYLHAIVYPHIVHRHAQKRLFQCL